ncbi:MAG: YecA family protein [Candidatus Binatia bacterium]
MDTQPRRSLGRFFLYSFVLFCFLLPAWGGVSFLYTRLLATVAKPILPSLQTSPGDQVFEFVVRTKGNSVFLIDPRGVTEATLDRAPALQFDTSQVHRNLPLLLALFFATPGMWRGQYTKQFGLALGVLVLWHAGYVTFVLRHLASQVASAAVGAETIRINTGLPFEIFLRLFIPQLLPFFLWIALVHFRPSVAKQESEARPRVVGRNDPCPCGSGRKYKRCCGASAASAM